MGTALLVLVVNASIALAQASSSSAAGDAALGGTMAWVGNVTSSGFLVWFAYYTTSKSMPAAYREARAESQSKVEYYTTVLREERAIFMSALAQRDATSAEQLRLFMEQLHLDRVARSASDASTAKAMTELVQEIEELVHSRKSTEGRSS